MTRALQFAVIAMIAWSACLEARAATTALYFNSAKGDYIGQGVTRVWTPADGAFTAKKNNDNGVEIRFDAGSTWWTLNFAAPQKAPLAVGDYVEATRYPFQSATVPGLDVSGSGRGCNNLFGKFTINEVTYGAGDQILAFAATFEQHCEQTTAPALQGKVFFGAETTTLTDTQAPTVPASLVISPKSTSQIDLTWKASTDDFAVSAYKVYRDGTLITTLGNVAGFSDTGLSASTDYAYAVAACDAAGNCSAQGATASARTQGIPDSQAPSVPTGLIATADSPSQITLAWTASTDNLGVAAYKIYRSGTLTATVGNVTSVTILKLPPATGYIYTISACDVSGNCSGQSAAVSVKTLQDTQAPTAPTGLIATAVSASQVNLDWAASTDDVAVTTYMVYRDGVLLATFPPSTRYSDFGLTASTSFSYTVVACDVATNCSAPSTAALATTLPSSATFTTERADCLFNWAEGNYASAFAPGGSQSQAFGSYYFRYYSKTNSYLGVSSGNAFYLGPLSSGALLDLGAASTWYSRAGCG